MEVEDTIDYISYISHAKTSWLAFQKAKNELPLLEAISNGQIMLAIGEIIGKLQKEGKHHIITAKDVYFTLQKEGFSDLTLDEVYSLILRGVRERRWEKGIPYKGMLGYCLTKGSK